VPESKVPYVTASGNVVRALQGIQRASQPERFTVDFLETKLGLKGGSARPVIPFLKRTGFLNSDGSPTKLYTRFRNPSQAGAAAAEALHYGFRPLYEVNEYVHDLSDAELKGVVVQVTGMEDTAGGVQAIVGSFKGLKQFADFDASSGTLPSVEPADLEESTDIAPRGNGSGPITSGINLGYTINLHLPPTSDVAVFNAIFKSLRENLLRPK
jgi:Family of unknown function (DUF5343)